MDDVVIGLQHAALTADGLAHAFDAIDDVLSRDAVEKNVLLRDADVAGDLFGLFDIVFGDLHLIFGEAVAAAIVQRLNVSAADAEEDIADHHVTAVFGTHESVVEAGLHGFKIDNLAFAHATGRCLTHTEDFDGSVTLCLTHDDADFVRSDFESGVDGAFGHKSVGGSGFSGLQPG